MMAWWNGSKSTHNRRLLQNCPGERIMNRVLILKTLRDIRRSWAQTSALAFIIMLGVTSYIALLGAYRDLGNSYSHIYKQLSFADLTYSIYPTGSGIVETVQKIPGVAAAQGRLIVDLGMTRPGTLGKPGKEQQIRARLIGLPQAVHPAVNDVLVLNGRYFQPGDRKVVLLETHFAEAYQLKPGDTVYPLLDGKELPLQVIGVVASPEYLIVSPDKQEIVPTARTFGVLFMPSDELHKIFNLNDSVTNIAVRLMSNTNPQSVNVAIKEPLKRIGLIETTFQKDQPSNNALQADLGGYREIAFLMPGIILLVAAFSVYVLLGRQVHSQQRQIGLMKALGYANLAIVGGYLGYALVIGLSGGLLGVLVGSWLEGGITTEYALELGIPLVQTRFYPDLAWQGVLLSLFFSMMAGIGPALSATRVAPAVAMRQDPSISLEQGRRSLIDRLIPLPVWMRMAIRNLSRARRRTFSTALGIIFSFILILMTWGMLDAMNHLVDHYFNVTNRWDEMVTFSDPSLSGLGRALESEWPGVQKIEPIVQFPATINLPGQDKDIVLNGLLPDQELYSFQMTSGGTPAGAMANHRVILTTALANILNLHIGDPLTITISSKKQEAIIGGTTDEMITSNVYVDYQTARDWTGGRGLVSYGYYLKVDPARAEQIRSELYHLSGVANVQLKSEMEKEWQALFGLFYAFIGMILIFAMGMVFALLFNTTTVNVLERERELATMRSIGTDGRWIAFLVTVESVILFFITLIPGLLVGNWAAGKMGNAFQTDLFSFQMVVSVRSYLLSAICILLVIVISALPAIRHINQLDLAEATKTIA
jgi:putative ABC transport system permease protein